MVAAGHSFWRVLEPQARLAQQVLKRAALKRALQVVMPREAALPADTHRGRRSCYIQDCSRLALQAVDRAEIQLRRLVLLHRASILANCAPAQNSSDRFLRARSESA